MKTFTTCGVPALLLALTVAAVPSRHAVAQSAGEPVSSTNESAKADKADAPKAGDVAPKTAKEHKPYDLRTTKRLTGDWGGARTKLEDEGITFKIDVMNQIMANLHGGLETKNGHDTAGSYEFNVYLDLEKMNLIDGAEFWIRGKGTWGGDDSDFDKEKIGAFFKTNQDAGSEEPIFVDKWHYRQYLFDKKLELRIGRMEPVKDLFDRSSVMGHEDKWFLNRALVRNATIPSHKGLGVFLKWKFSKTAYLSAAALDAQAQDRQTNFNTAFHDEDWFRYFFELGCTPSLKSKNGDLPGLYRIGTWYDPTRKTKFFDTLGGLRAERHESGDWGFYVGFDQMVWKENDNPKDKQGFSIAARYGYAHGDVNRVDNFWAFGTKYQGLVSGRDKDLFGIGVAQGIMSDQFRRIHARADRETVYEMYYSYQVTPWLTISPDLQFVTNAGGDKDDDNALVAGIRIRMVL